MILSVGLNVRGVLATINFIIFNLLFSSVCIRTHTGNGGGVHMKYLTYKIEML